LRVGCGGFCGESLSKLPTLAFARHASNASIAACLAAERMWGWNASRQHFLCMLAEASLESGRLDDGLSALNEAMATTNEQNGPFFFETCRLTGELLLRQHDSNAVEAQRLFEFAIEVARKQSAKSLELRATLSLARLLAKQGKRDEARAILAEVYNWFTEGFDTADLKDAKALLNQLNA
jgi:predicted ATPase